MVKTEIEEGLRLLGLGPGMAVEAHSSLKSFGHVEGGAATVVDALMAVVGQEGAIVMSAYPISKGRPLTNGDVAKGITYKAEIIPGDSIEPTNVGAVVDEFKRRPGVVLGQGVHRGVAWGRAAELNCRNYKHLVKTGGSVLLIGVGIGNCSCMHIPEETIGIPPGISALSALPPDVLREYPGDKWYVECDRVPGAPRNAWQAVWEEALGAGLVRTGKIGNAECHLFKAADVIGILERHLRTDPWALYGVSKPGR